MSGTPSSRSGLAWIAEVIKAKRAGVYTLEQLAMASGVSAGLLSQIERSMGNPSLGTLEKIADALDISLGAFFQPPEENVDDRVVRADARRRLVVPTNGRAYELLTPYPHESVALLRTVIDPSITEPSEARHAGDEVVLVVDGELVVTVDGIRYELATGDTVTYDSSLWHSWRNESNKPVDVLAIRHPPYF